MSELTQVTVADLDDIAPLCSAAARRQYPGGPDADYRWELRAPFGTFRGDTFRECVTAAAEEGYRQMCDTTALAERMAALKNRLAAKQLGIDTDPDD